MLARPCPRQHRLASLLPTSAPISHVDTCNIGRELLSVIKLFPRVSGAFDAPSLMQA